MVRDASERLAKEPDVGRVADGVVAERLGISRKTVLAYRKRNGIPAWDEARVAGRAPAVLIPASERRSKASRLDPLLDIVGKVSDREVAQQAGVSPENVRIYRLRRGIAATWRDNEPGTRVERALAALEHQLGVDPDAVIAQRAGVSRSAVTQYRAQRGIAAGRAEGTVPGVKVGWAVTVRTRTGEERLNVLAAVAADACVLASEVGEVLRVERIGRVI